jgi:hypothetical protein
MFSIDAVGPATSGVRLHAVASSSQTRRSRGKHRFEMLPIALLLGGEQHLPDVDLALIIEQM